MPDGGKMAVVVKVSTIQVVLQHLLLSARSHLSFPRAIRPQQMDERACSQNNQANRMDIHSTLTNLSLNTMLLVSIQAG